MKKITNVAELERLRRLVADSARIDKATILLCKSTGCGAFGSNRLFSRFHSELKREGLETKVDIKATGCHGFCERGPIVVIRPQGIFYQRCKPEHVRKIVSMTILKGEVIEELLYEDPATGNKIIFEKDVPFYKSQTRLVFAESGKIDPTSIEEYIAAGGYSAFQQALTSMTPESIIAEVTRSGLRGRGGAGFPTGQKWQATRNRPGETKHIICNADEGDPGAYMDRSILESNPHSVIEGMMIGAYAIGATEGWMYIRHEYPLAIDRTIKAIEQARALGLLGKNILGSKFFLDIKIARGAGAFVCGEETALIASIESKRGVPRQRPPFPASSGLFGKPTNINNVETWATIPIIIRRGGDWFARIGTATSKGTKIFSLVGKVRNTGLVEVPMGTTLQQVVYDIGGGAPKGRKVKAIQTGGPSGGCIPASLFNLPVDYESLTRAGAIMGSGGMIVMDEGTCMVDIAKYFTNFLRAESCGKCVTCREGTQRMHEILADITEGNGRESDPGVLTELGNVVKDASMCGLGQTAANPVLATLRYFRNEYEEHIGRKRCSAAVCKEIISSPCQHTCPIDTEAQTYISLIARRHFKEALRLIKKNNPLCSVLARVCHHPCETRCRAGEGGDPISIRDLKRFATDYGLKNKLDLKAQPACKNGLGKVAIIGSGPAGLTCGFHLAQKGYDVAIFEKNAEAGGMLALAIPSYRLPRAILQADIDYIKSSGVEIRTSVNIGKDISIEHLINNGYQALFIAVGAHKSAKLNLPGEDADGVLPAINLLSAINSGRGIALGKRIAIVGGGNAAIDAARTALRTGIPEHITIYYRRTISEMPAFKEEVKAAIDEGITIEFLTAPVNILTKNGKLIACEFVRMELGETDKNGRKQPSPIRGSEFIVSLDTLVVAVGEKPETSFLANDARIQLNASGTIVVDPETLRTSHERIFAGGDIVTGPNTIVDAVSAGKVAAESIDNLLRKREMKREYKITRPSMYVEPVELSAEELLDLRRPERPCLTPDKRKSTFEEVDRCLTEEQAVKEARRCLRCDLETKDGRRFLEKIKGHPQKREESLCQR